MTYAESTLYYNNVALNIVTLRMCSVHLPCLIAEGNYNIITFLHYNILYVINYRTPYLMASFLVLT